MDENARLRLDRGRAAQASVHEASNSRLAATAVPQARPAEYSLTQTRSAYPYTSGLKLEPSAAAVSNVTSLGYSGHPY